MRNQLEVTEELQSTGIQPGAMGDTGTVTLSTHATTGWQQLTERTSAQGWSVLQKGIHE